MMADTTTDVTYHLVRRDIWQAADPQVDYVPATVATEGFVHTTEAPREVLATARRHLPGQWDDLLVLVLDRRRINAPVRYDDVRRLYPHIYGPLNRDAITSVMTLASFAAQVPAEPEAP